MKLKQFEENESYIYKYGKFKDLQRTLNNRTLGFSRLNKLNDPFEASYNHVHLFATKQRASAFSESGIFEGPEWADRNKVKELIESKLQEVVVTCFTERPTEPLMWAHYADNHKGVCYCFDKEALSFEGGFECQSIQYSNKVPDVFIFENSTTEAQLEMYMPNLICTKSEAWAYEKEIRYFGESSETVHNFDITSLKAVILGCRVTIEKTLEARKLINSINKKFGTEIGLFHAIKDGGLYKMQIHLMQLEQFKISASYCSQQEPIIKV
ncbi:DUF2971 domain-containing protein [Vibrio parahaemolyticus]|uniref:DUF2971 domain-containing protein n=1 Tax=Vibrio parahaemolyticus TaxID=670 RepID=UPI0004DA375E|nr:DUF2971 domain-containing protein [Vibrio parahaemolyticus]EHK9100270.1 DUF2971 domain-containing protein [Vibrio parahaemolyticus]EJO9910304.1 DUF2971 domain-containing protein [Vibrio parahaemolyticus]ELM4063016.1 DUF2971 domain-containing protein [Vibrio parahaemolyticus]OQU04119.1 hypothetical protein EN00_013375 [Vibrio parahaemolyticus]